MEMAQTKVKMRLFLLTLFFSVFFVAVSKPSYAQSDYVLPYPSFMPGSTFYKLHLIIEEMQKYWYFGNFGTFLYNVKQADKYLVEAKTLFEYKQYLLGSKALEKSDIYFVRASQHLNKAKIEGREIAQKQNMFRNALLRHKEVLQELKKKIPERFVWQPEKEDSTALLLWSIIDSSIRTRESCI